MKNKIFLMFLIISMLLVLGGCSSGETESPNQGAKEDDQGGNPEEDHAHGEYEWIGEFELEAGTYLFHFGPSPDETMDVGFVKMGDNITDLEHHAAHLMETDKETIKEASTFEAKPDYAYTFEMNEDHGHIHFTIAESGTYAIVTEHFPSESNMQVLDEDEVEILPIKEYEGEAHSH